MNTETKSRYFKQPMTGKIHTNSNCPMNRAHVALVPVTWMTDDEVEARIADPKSRETACKKCGPA